MRKRPGYVVIHDPAAGKRGGAPDDPGIAAIPGNAPAPAQPGQPFTASAAPSAGVAAAAPRRPPTRSRAAPKEHITAGIWDLGSWAARLGGVIERINAAQPIYEVKLVEASIPAGMVSRPERVIAWAAEQLGKSIRGAERKEFADNVIADEFFVRAERVRRNIAPPLDYLIGITPSMVAGADGDEVYWNHFASASGRTALVSTHDVREYAKRAERPFEVAVVGLAMSALFVAAHRSVGYHDDTGCVFDYNGARTTLVGTLKRLYLEPSCLAAFPAAHRDSVQAILKVLQDYRGPG
jgi:hypothetical protein